MMPMRMLLLTVVAMSWAFSSQRYWGPHEEPRIHMPALL